jgi:hypothetical protein
MCVVADRVNEEEYREQEFGAEYREQEPEDPYCEQEPRKALRTANPIPPLHILSYVFETQPISLIYQLHCFSAKTWLVAYNCYDHSLIAYNCL